MVRMFGKILLSLSMFMVYFLSYGIVQTMLTQVHQHIVGVWYIFISTILLLLVNIMLKNSFKWYHKVTIPKGTTIVPYSNKAMIFSMVLNFSVILISVFNLTLGISILLILKFVILMMDLYCLNPILIVLNYNVYKVKDDSKTRYLIGKISKYPYYKPIELITDKDVVELSDKVLIG